LPLCFRLAFSSIRTICVSNYYRQCFLTAFYEDFTLPTMTQLTKGDKGTREMNE